MLWVILTQEEVELKVWKQVAGAQVIRAFVPLSEMFGYATTLRSRTQGRGTYSMEFDHYEEVPKSIQEKVLQVKRKLNRLDLLNIIL